MFMDLIPYDELSFAACEELAATSKHSGEFGRRTMVIGNGDIVRMER
jgi:hypothetical protein